MGWIIVCILGVLLSVQHFQCNGAVTLHLDINTTKLSTKDFQVNFQNEITDITNKVAQNYLDEYLKQLDLSGQNETIVQKLAKLQRSENLEQKVAFIKEQPKSEGSNALRNAIFLKNFRNQLVERQDGCPQQLKKLRFFHMCRQFEQKTAQLPWNLAVVSASAPIQPSVNGNLSSFLVEFGQKVYDRVKIDGTYIVDEFVGKSKRIFYEVSELQELQDSEMGKLLLEMDSILDTVDFYEKLQILYQSFGGNLTESNERSRRSAGTLDDLLNSIGRLFAILFGSAINIGFHFLYSSFQLLELLHDEWMKELMPLINSTQLTSNEDVRLLYAVSSRYRDVKLYHEDAEKIEDYIKVVKELYERSERSAEKVHIYEMLYNISRTLDEDVIKITKSSCKDAHKYTSDMF